MQLDRLRAMTQHAANTIAPPAPCATRAAIQPEAVSSLSGHTGTFATEHAWRTSTVNEL
jgi:hypothetical protein